MVSQSTLHTFRFRSLRREVVLTSAFAVGIAVPLVSIVSMASASSYGGALPFALLCSAWGEFTVISLGFRRVTINDVGVAVHKLWFVTTRIPWDAIESIEYPDRLTIWNSPTLRRIGGGTERIVPLTFGRLERRKAEVALRAVATMSEALADYRRTKGSRPRPLG